MKKKLLYVLFYLGLALFTEEVFGGNEYKNFQEFDRQFNLNFGMGYTTLKNGIGSEAGVTQQSYGLEIERLFNVGVWFDVNANMLVSSLNNQVNGLGSGQSVFNQSPNFGGLNAKVGYAFDIVKSYLLLTPYGLVGRNTNLTASTLYYSNSQNITDDFYYTGGVGGRLEYRFNKVFDMYLDQIIAYNWDQSIYVRDVVPQNAMIYTTALGTKFNVYKQLQIGVNGFYTNYQNLASIPTDPLIGTGVYHPSTSYGGMLTIGLIY